MARTIGHSGYDAKSGEQPQWVLEIDVDPLSGNSSGTDPLLYSAEDDVPIAGCVGRVMDFGQLTLAARPGQNTAVNTVTVTLADPTRVLAGLQETKPGLQGCKAYIKLYFGGADPVTIFGGYISTPMTWTESSAQVVLTLKDFGALFDYNIGKILTVDDFPEVDCSQCENRIIPVVYGNPCYRVPACVIDRPGRAQLASTLLIQNNTLTINTTAAKAGFSSGTEITLIVGVAGFWERFTGSFDSTDDTTFTITSRGAILAAGDISFFGAGGQQYITIPKADIPDAGAASRGGYPFHVNVDGTWTTLVATYWSPQGSSIVVTEKGQLDLGEGDNYILGSTPGWSPFWQAGTPVVEVGTWTYAVNHLPSKSVDRVEGTMNVSAGGRQRGVMATLNSAYYSVNLNNKDFNSNLGRDPGDPGLTTITLSYSPVQIGSDSETVYCTLKGTSDDLLGGGDPFTSPADIIEHLLTDPRLANLHGSFVNAASFAAAKAEISTTFSFALLDEKKTVNQAVTELAAQANCITFWDQGQIHLKYLEDVPNIADSVLTVDNDSRQASQITIEETDVKDYTTQLIGKFRPAIPADDLLLMRVSTEAIAFYGEKRDEMSFWGYQYPSSVALATENWLKFWLHRNRRVTFTTFLNALILQPGDIITLDFDDGAGNAIVAGAAQVMEVRHTPGNIRQERNEQIQIVCEMNLWTHAIQVDAPTDDNCAGDFLTRHYGASAKYFLRSTGTRRSMFVGPVEMPGPNINGNLDDPIEPEQFPDADVVVPVAMIANWHPRNFDGTPFGSSSDDSSAANCIRELGGITLRDLTAETSPDYVVSLVDGCLRLTPVAVCPVTSSSGG